MEQAAAAMRVFHVQGDRFTELPALPAQLPAAGFVWVGCGRPGFGAGAPALQAALAGWGITPLVDLHVLDLLNDQLPSQFDDTSWYDLLVFRRLAAGAPAGEATPGDGPPPARPVHGPGPAAAARRLLAAIDTHPVGFVVLDRVLLTVHPADCPVREHFVQRLGQLAHPGQAPAHTGAAEGRHHRLPGSPADLMLRMVNHMVDGYLDLRRLLTRQLSDLQRQLLDPRSRFTDWPVLLESRNTLHLLEDTCEDQRSAVQEWIDVLDESPDPVDTAARRERELLRVRSRDVLEHIERVLTHVRRLEQSAEAAVQMHFSAVGHRTNDIMRTLTAITAVFLPLNLITGFFGMNFEGLPLIHSSTGVWIAVAMMVVIALALGGFFWRRRYLGSQRR